MGEFALVLPQVLDDGFALRRVQQRRRPRPPRELVEIFVRRLVVLLPLERPQLKPVVHLVLEEGALERLHDGRRYDSSTWIPLDGVAPVVFDDAASLAVDVVELEDAVEGVARTGQDTVFPLATPLHPVPFFLF